MIDIFLRLVGYKNKYGRWDKSEIIVDLIVISLAIVVGATIGYFLYEGGL